MNQRSIYIEPLQKIRWHKTKAGLIHQSSFLFWLVRSFNEPASALRTK